MILWILNRLRQLLCRMRLSCLRRLTCCIVLISMTFYILLFFENEYSIIISKNIVKKVKHIWDSDPLEHETVARVNKPLKYVLLWNPNLKPLIYLKENRTSFMLNKCEKTNCFISYNKSFFADLTQFDAIIFSSIGVTDLRYGLPSRRSFTQKYIFTTPLGSSNVPIPNPMMDNFFNWTWTYRLNSDIPWRNFKIRNWDGIVVGPSDNIKWPIKYSNLSTKFNEKLYTKSKPVLWIQNLDMINTLSLYYIHELQMHLAKYGWSIDMHKGCDFLDSIESQKCYNQLKKQYFFYLAFEDSWDADYVTETILIGMKNLIVPVVFGGADYSRFLPPGSYIDATKQSPEAIARIINHDVRNLDTYQKYFVWTSHFKYETSKTTSEICNLCATLNDINMMNVRQTYPDFRVWWRESIKQEYYDIFRNLLDNKEIYNATPKYNHTNESGQVLFDIHEQPTTEDLINITTTEIRNEDIYRDIPTFSFFFDTDKANYKTTNTPTNTTTTDSTPSLVPLPT